MENLILAAKLAGALISVLVGIFGLRAAYTKHMTYKKKLSIIQDGEAQYFFGQFNSDEINQELSGYIVPHCSPSDPSNKDGEEFLADTRESIFSYFDRNIESSKKSYNLLLADTGMGKTSFSINYFSHVRNKFKSYTPSIVSLSSNDSIDRIKKIPNKSRSILIADAFYEDPNAIKRGKERLSEILSASADFKFVVITCRSQYFTRLSP